MLPKSHLYSQRFRPVVVQGRAPMWIDIVDLVGFKVSVA